MDQNVVVIGGSNIGICAKSTDAINENDFNIGKVEFALGGTARNIAEDLSLFGADVSLLTAIADDSFGAVVRDNANEQNVALLLEPFKDKGCKTGVNVYIVDSDGNIKIGINDVDITSKITPAVVEENINALYFADYVIVDTNLPQDTIEKIASHDFKLIADCVSSKKCLKLANVLDKIFMLKGDIKEILSLSGKDNLTDAIKALVARGLKRGLIPLRADGAMCFESQEDGIHTWTIGNMPGHVIVDNAGCGDALVAGSTLAIMRGKDMQHALIVGQSAACLNADDISCVNRKMTFSALKETAKKLLEKTEVVHKII